MVTQDKPVLTKLHKCIFDVHNSWSKLSSIMVLGFSGIYNQPVNSLSAGLKHNDNKLI